MDETKLAEAAPTVGDGLPEALKHDGQETIHGREDHVMPASGEQTPVMATIQGFTDKALHFLSHASNETLGACLIGLGATTYMVLGRVGLLVIGVAGGVVLHATWEGIRSDDRDEATKQAEREQRRETGAEVARRALAWRTTATSSEEKAADVKVYANQQLDFSSFGPETAAALATFTDSVLKDYVHYWYDATLPGEESFPAACKRTLTAFLLSLSGHLNRKRPADAFLDFVTNASSIIIVFLNELSAALNASPNASAEDAVATYLRMKPDSSLAYMLDQTAQNAKLADIAEDILQAYLDPKAYNCPPVHAFLKEVLAQLILGYTVTYCSESDFINDWILYGLEESETTKEVMDIVDAGVEGRSTEASAAKAAEQANMAQDVRSNAEIVAARLEPSTPEQPVAGRGRNASRGEDAMDEAMREAKRLTQMMIEEDERRAREEQEKHAAMSSSEDVSDSTTHGAPTPTSSQSDKERQSEDISAWGTEPSSAMSSPTRADMPPMTPTSKQPFTSFDQILPSQQPTALGDSPERARREPPQLTLHNATISIFDDSQPNERTAMKSKPTMDYLVQIEPASSHFSGWMIVRKYADFETLHEVLRRISAISGVPLFTQTHPELPKWRTNTKSGLRAELERYLTDAVRFQPLAESEGMKRFLEKDQGLAKSPSERAKGFGWPTPDAFGKFGGDMMNVLTKAPKQVAGSGKAVFGGVAGLVGGKRSMQSPSLSRTNTDTAIDTVPSSTHRSSQSFAQPTVTDSYGGSMSSPAARQSQESIRSMAKQSRDRQGSVATTASAELRPRPSVSSSRLSRELDRAAESLPSTADASPSTSQTQIAGLDAGLEAAVSLPPPPSEMPDDFRSPMQASRTSADMFQSTNVDQPDVGTEAAPPMPPRPAPPATTAKPEAKPKEPLSERETSVAIELMFAVITELYTLSSAWQFRRTLLAAAKNFLLRPGNPQLLTIRDMLQSSLLDSNLSDSGIAGHVYKLRENGLPTVEETEIWRRDYPEKTQEQKEELRVKARKLLVTKGMPAALTSVMGAAASGEALGKVFDCLQLPEVSRGLVFGLLLQALKIITH